MYSRSGTPALFDSRMVRSSTSVKFITPCTWQPGDVAQGAAQHVDGDEGAEVADVAAGVDRQAAGVHPDHAVARRGEVLFGSGERVVEAHQAAGGVGARADRSRKQHSSAPAPWSSAAGTSALTLAKASPPDRARRAAIGRRSPRRAGAHLERRAPPASAGRPGRGRRPAAPATARRPRRPGRRRRRRCSRSSRRPCASARGPSRRGADPRPPTR